jgi:beta-glucosidase-like glycosyl hydrolase
VPHIFTYARTTAAGEGLDAEFICVTNWYDAGSVLSGGGSVPAPQASAEAWASMLSEMQKGALSTHLGIPMIYGIDAVHGHNNAYRATIFPHNVGLGATR